MSRVFVLDANRSPLAPCAPARARLLLKQRKAAVLRRFPFTLILKEVKSPAEAVALRLKLDPGSKTTGVAVLDEGRGEVVWAAELSHRGNQVRDALTKRRAARRSRRQRHTRYRAARFANRRRQQGWLPPSLRSRLQNVLTWVNRLLSMDRYGFPRTRAKRSSAAQGFRTGDMVRAEVASGKKSGVYVGRVAVRATGSFNLTTRTGTVQGIPARDVIALQRSDGYNYKQNRDASTPKARMGGGLQS